MAGFSSLLSRIKTPSISELKKRKIPEHVAIIMDGNGRWASRRKLPRIFGHRKGAEVLRDMVISCKDIGVKYLTAFSFSSENWQRPEEEISELMLLFVEVLKRELPGLIKNDVKLNLLGNRKVIPENVLAVFLDAEEKTKYNKSLVFNIAFSYGSRQEIYDAILKIAEKLCEDKAAADGLNPESISDYLYTSGMPDPDLLIRTSGEYRVSNFLLWQIAYTELYFTKVLWPDFSRARFFRAVFNYQNRVRRFGKV